jgi:serine acetyltransferase/glycosyltransferase involved in cell wall biosynthesis
MNPRVSVVIATRNRSGSLVRLVRQLGAQDLSPESFEIVVVDDASPEPVAPLLAELPVMPAVRVARIPWSGPGAARNRGATLARGEILVFLDDDMQVGPGFLAAHLSQHDAAAGAVVLGHIEADPGLAQMPLFERYHARQLARWRAAVAQGQEPVRGVHLCTGNVSMRRAAFEAVGGFDATLERSEDRELGIRLEAYGCTFRFGEEAVAVHSSDHADVGVWLRRAYLYGRVDRRIAARHPGAGAHPWRFWALIHPLSRPVVALALLSPALGGVLARLAYAAGAAADKVRLGRAGVTLAALAYALQYFAGLRAECGSLAALHREARLACPRRGVLGEWRALKAAVRADYESVRFYRQKYRAEEIPPGRLAVDLVCKVGFQMLAVYRLMRFFRACRVPVVPMVISRLIRHVYGAEIHWDAQLAPGVSIVHGVGLVISHAAVVDTGCILFQHVTLGEGIDATTGVVGAPALGRDVHVAPGAVLLGPIDIGDQTKVAAGVVLTQSVPARSLVLPPAPVVSSRRNGGGLRRAIPVAARARAGAAGADAGTQAPTAVGVRGAGFELPADRSA